MDRHEGVGVTPRELRTGTVVMVPVGKVNAVVNGGPCVIAWAVVQGPAAYSKGATAMYWLDVYLAPGGRPTPQMYHAGEILGVPAPGLSMVGAPCEGDVGG